MATMRNATWQQATATAYMRSLKGKQNMTHMNILTIMKAKRSIIQMNTMSITKSKTSRKHIIAKCREAMVSMLYKNMENIRSMYRLIMNGTHTIRPTMSGSLSSAT